MRSVLCLRSLDVSEPDSLEYLSKCGQKIKKALSSYADCDRSSIRLLTWENSETNASVLLPASVAASISVLNNMAVAISALHSRQHFSVLPGSSNNSSRWPQTLHAAIESFSVPFGPFNMTVPFLPLSACLSTGEHRVDLLKVRRRLSLLPEDRHQP